MGFDQFVGNQATVTKLRRAIAAGRVPPALILTGPKGSGKYTLSIMLTQAMACLQRPSTGGLPDFCGICSNCIRIAQSLPLEERCKEAVAAREELRETDKRDTRILLQTHPDLMIIPPDPPQLLIKIGQVRNVLQRIYHVPLESQKSVYVFTSASFMKEAANSLLKILEEPPEYAHLILLAENTADLLPTIRSRCVTFRLDPLPAAEIDSLLAERSPQWKPRERALISRLAAGGVGRALNFDLGVYLAHRQDAFVLLHNATRELTETASGKIRGGDFDFSALFKMTESYKAGAEGQEKTANLLSAFVGLLEDLLLIRSGAGHLVRNVDIAQELAPIANAISVRWIESAAHGVNRVEQGLRRNSLRSLSIDAFAMSMAQP